MADTGHPRMVQIHAMPKTGNPSASKAFDEYVAGEPIEGFQTRKQARRQLYGYLLPRESGNSVDQTVSVTSGTRTETLGFSKSSGGIVLEWTTVDTGINVQWLNHRGACTRGLQTKWLVVDEDGAHNAVQGGSASEGDADAASVQTLADGFTLDDIIQGSIITKFEETDLGGGSYQIDISTIPMELDFHGDEGGPDHGGTCIDPICYENVSYDTRITVNWDGNVGVHRIDCTVNVPQGRDGAANWDTTIQSRMDFGVCGLIFGWDEVIAYRNESGGTYTTLTNINVYAGMSAPTLTSVTSASDIVTIVFQSDQGRIVNTTEKFIITNASPSVINGTHDFLWTDSTTAVGLITGSGSQSFTGTVVNSDTQEWQLFDDAYIRTSYKDRLVIAEGLAAKYTSDNQEGTFPGKGNDVWSVGSTARNALIHRATGVASYSLDNDFAVGLYVASIDNFGDTDTARGIFQWQSVRDGTTPSGTVSEMPMCNMWRARFWNATTVGLPATPYTETVYILTGTYANIQSSITTLDAESNASLGFTND